MIDPYNLSEDYFFQKFFGKILTKGEIMKSDDIPCDNTHLEAIENAKRAYQGDIDMVIEAIAQQMTVDDIEYLFTSPLIFGEILQGKVLAYIDSIVESEFNEKR